MRLFQGLTVFAAVAFGAPQQFDVVVYGGTAGGVITAVTAAREGLRTALLEPGNHLGGMVSGGLGWTDFGKKEVIGGTALEFYVRLGRHYEMRATVTNSHGCTSRTLPRTPSARC